MKKRTKITIILDQPMNEYAEEIGRSLLGQRLCFGAYSSFDQSRVTFEEVDEVVGEVIPLQQKTKLTDNDLWNIAGVIVNIQIDRIKENNISKPSLTEDWFDFLKEKLN